MSAAITFLFILLSNKQTEKQSKMREGPKMAFPEILIFLKSNNCYHSKLQEAAAAPGEGFNFPDMPK